MNDANPDASVVVSYDALRTLIGLLGVALPTTAWLGSWALDGEALLGSISTYYYSSMRDVLVGILVLTGVFLATYQGYRGRDERLWGHLSDNLLTNLAGIAAIAVALFPAAACEAERCLSRFPAAEWTQASFVHWVHVGSAGVFFLAMGVMALFVFTKSDRHKPGAEVRHWIFVGTGTVILMCLALMAIYGILPSDIKAPLERYRPVFFGEAFGIWAFGLAWLAKGRALQTGRGLLGNFVCRLREQFK